MKYRIVMDAEGSILSSEILRSAEVFVNRLFERKAEVVAKAVWNSSPEQVLMHNESSVYVSAISAVASGKFLEATMGGRERVKDWTMPAGSLLLTSPDHKITYLEIQNLAIPVRETVS
jgi:hypothetical protein